MDLWATDEVHFQQHGSRCRMWIPPEIKDPVLLHAPTPPVVGAGDGLWSFPTMLLITTRDSTSRGGKSTPTGLSWTSFLLIVPK